MSLNQIQITTLMRLVAQTSPDELDCDGCLDHIAEFAEIHLAGRPLCEAMSRVQIHLENCVCCEHEFQSFLEALKGMAESE